MKFSGFKSNLFGLVLAGTVLFSVNASATVLLERLPSAVVNGEQADAATVPYTESLNLAGPVLIEKISWWGYYGTDPLIDPSTDNFLVEFNSATQSGTITESPIDDVSGFTFYEMTLTSAYAFSGGATTLALINDSLDVEWYWQGADSQLQGPRALRLEGVQQGQPVPEPEILSLLGLGLMSLAFLSRRSRKFF